MKKSLTRPSRPLPGPLPRRQPKLEQPHRQSSAPRPPQLRLLPYLSQPQPARRLPPRLAHKHLRLFPRPRPVLPSQPPRTPPPVPTPPRRMPVQPRPLHRRAAWSCRRPAHAPSTKPPFRSPRRKPLRPPACSAANLSSTAALPALPARVQAASARVPAALRGHSPAVRAPSTLRAAPPAALLLVALAGPARVLDSDSAPASALVPALAVPVQAPAARRLRVKRRARNAHRRVAVAVVSSSTPRPKKAR